MNPAEQQQPRRRRGCLFWGGIIAAILLLFALLAGYAGYRYMRHLVFDYTADKPTEMPAVPMSGTELTNLQRRVEKFDQALQEGKPVEPLQLTADEINALIEHGMKTNAVLRPHLYFTFTNDQVHAQLSVPTDGIGLRMLKGRYFNGSGDFDLSLHNSRLMLHVKSLSVKGKPLPEQFMQSVRTENFADAWTNDAELNGALAKLQEVKIENDRLIVVPKAVPTNSAAPAAPAPKPDPGK